MKYPEVIATRRDPSSKRIYNSTDFDVRLPNGDVRTWSAIEGPDIVVVLPIDEAGNIIMKKEFRLSQGKPILELTSGRIDESDKSPKDCAIRELREEVGVKAKKITLLGKISLWNHCTVRAHIFLAEGVTRGKNDPDADEIVKVVLVPLRSALRTLKRAGTNAQTLIGIYMALDKLGLGASGYFSK